MPTLRVLGQTEVIDGGHPVDIGGPRARRLLAALLAVEGGTVSDGELAEAVWADRQPANPLASLQVYVSRLRFRLRAVGVQVTRCAGVGYRISVPAGSTDADRFSAGVAEGRALLTAGRARAALRALDTALDQWRGEPYADLPAFAPALAARARLTQTRRIAVEERLAARLAGGDPAGAIAELAAAVRAEPYRQRRWELLIQAYHGSGGHTEALAALHRVRALLADDLGVDPGPELLRLEQRVLSRQRDSVRPAGFLGRRKELAALADLVAARRLVTLTGPAGAGKTRLAVEYAATRGDPDGPWLVRLADVTDPQVLPATVAAALGLSQVDGDPLAGLVVALEARAGLLVLDNCEHLAAAVGEFVLTLLAEVTSLTVLVTGRAPLNVPGEQVLPVGPLPAGTALDLLMDRISVIHPGLRPDADDLDDARRVAAALEGIPLALELAAAQTHAVPLRGLAEHVRFGSVPRRSLTIRTTLDAAIAWNIDTLSTPDRELLSRLWPFAGGFPLDAVPADAAEALSTLVTRSIVVADPGRYRLPEPIRCYCRDHDPLPGTSAAAHARWVRELVDRGAQDLLGDRAPHAMRVLNRELPNIRAGIAHDLRVQPASALRSVGLLCWFWYRDGRLAEGHRLLSAALNAAPDAPTVDVARAWSAHGVLYCLTGDAPRTADALRRAATTLGIPDDLEGRILRGQLLCSAALYHLGDNNTEAACRSAAVAVRIGTELGAEWIAATGQTMLGAALLAMNRTTEGRDMLRAAIRRALDNGQHWTAAYSELVLSRHMVAAGDPVDSTLRTLHSAAVTMRREDDIANLLAAVDAGAMALANAGHTERAARLRVAARRHAARHGVARADGDGYAMRVGVSGGSGQLADVPAGEPLDWDSTIALLGAR